MHAQMRIFQTGKAMPAEREAGRHDNQQGRRRGIGTFSR